MARRCANWGGMEGTIKYFNAERGFGFIAIPDLKDRFFHVSDLQSVDVPRVGDSVSFEPASGKDGRPIARQVAILQRSQAPRGGAYYGKPTYRTEVVTPGDVRIGTAGTVGIFGTLGALVGGPIGAAVGAGLGALIGPMGEDREAVTRAVPITRTCLRCGDQGHITASLEGFTGFQCPKCKSFWKVRDKNLTEAEAQALNKPRPNR